MSSHASQSRTSTSRKPAQGAQKAKEIEIQPPVIDYVDMSRVLTEFVLEHSNTALYSFLNKGEKKYMYEIAEEVKKALDAEFKGAFHVIVGLDFGSYFSYEHKNCIQFWLNQFCFLIFKHG